MFSLGSELRRAGFSRDAEKFRDLVVHLKMDMFPHWTVEELLVRPSSSRGFCSVVRDWSKVPGLWDDVILRTLVNERKHGTRRVSPKAARRIVVRLVEELERVGYHGDPDVFRDAIVEALFVACPSWSDEELLFHPMEAHDLCELVRDKTNTIGLPDHVVLKTMLNFRKNGDRFEPGRMAG